MNFLLLIYIIVTSSLPAVLFIGFTVVIRLIFFKSQIRGNNYQLIKSSFVYFSSIYLFLGFLSILLPNPILWIITLNPFFIAYLGIVYFLFLFIDFFIAFKLKNWKTIALKFLIYFLATVIGVFIFRFGQEQEYDYTRSDSSIRYIILSLYLPVLIMTITDLVEIYREKKLHFKIDNNKKESK